MTKTQARDLQATWHAFGSPVCEHRRIDLEHNEDKVFVAASPAGPRFSIKTGPHTHKDQADKSSITRIAMEAILAACLPRGK